MLSYFNLKTKYNRVSTLKNVPKAYQENFIALNTTALKKDTHFVTKITRALFIIQKLLQKKKIESNII